MASSSSSSSGKSIQVGGPEMKVPEYAVNLQLKSFFIFCAKKIF